LRFEKRRNDIPNAKSAFTTTHTTTNNNIQKTIVSIYDYTYNYKS